MDDHKDENDSNHEDEQGSNHVDEKDSNHEDEEDSNHEDEEDSNHEDEEDSNHEDEEDSNHEDEQSSNNEDEKIIYEDEKNPNPFKMASKPRTVQEIFDDYCGRRKAIICALTEDADKLHRVCDPDKENLGLYGHPSGIWEANIPSNVAPADIPEPSIGINFIRDGLKRKEWLEEIAAHSEAWLISVAFFLGFCLTNDQRRELFRLINDLPPVLDIVKSIEVEDPPEDDSVEDSDEDDSDENEGSEEDDPDEDDSDEVHEDDSDEVNEDDSEEDEDDSEESVDIEKLSDVICGCCNEKFDPEQIWVGCDKCDKWFHGKCILLEIVENLRSFQCATCTSKSNK